MESNNNNAARSRGEDHHQHENLAKTFDKLAALKEQMNIATDPNVLSDCMIQIIQIQDYLETELEHGEALLTNLPQKGLVIPISEWRTNLPQAPVPSFSELESKTTIDDVNNNANNNNNNNIVSPDFWPIASAQMDSTPPQQLRQIIRYKPAVAFEYK